MPNTTQFDRHKTVVVLFCLHQQGDFQRAFNQKLGTSCHGEQCVLKNFEELEDKEEVTGLKKKKPSIPHEHCVKVTTEKHHCLHGLACFVHEKTRSVSVWMRKCSLLLLQTQQTVMSLGISTFLQPVKIS